MKFSINILSENFNHLLNFINFHISSQTFYINIHKIWINKVFVCFKIIFILISKLSTHSKNFISTFLASDEYMLGLNTDYFFIL